MLVEKFPGRDFFNVFKLKREDIESNLLSEVTTILERGTYWEHREEDFKAFFAQEAAKAKEAEVV